MKSLRFQLLVFSALLLAKNNFTWAQAVSEKKTSGWRHRISGPQLSQNGYQSVG